MNAKDFPSLVTLMDQGVQKEINIETETWNNRSWEKGGKLDRFPLSPSQIGKCALALGRSVSHYLGLSSYPRSPSSITPRVQRIFARGHTIEASLLDDFEKFTGGKVEDKQKRVKLHQLRDGRWIEGNIDGNLVFGDGTRITVDIKTKGAKYAANFTDSIQQFFEWLKEKQLVETVGENSYYIPDPEKLFNTISLDEFFVDYLLQLNAYATVENSDFAALYYENKNSCANYEVRWVPNAALYTYMQRKFDYIYDTVLSSGAEAIPKEFALGSSRCRLCDHNERCYGEYNPPVSRVTQALPLPLEQAYITATRANMDRTEENIIKYMEDNQLTHVELSNGVTYEKKYLKSPKPHFELRLAK